MNIVQLQEQLKNFSQDQLVREMQMPTGSTPKYLVLGEIMRRQRMQQDFAAQQGKGQPQSTVAEDAVAAAAVPQSGIAGMARALAPQTDMAQNTGVQAMAKGGTVRKMAEGDKIVKGGKIYYQQADGSYLTEDGRDKYETFGTSVANDLRGLGGFMSDLVPKKEDFPRFQLATPDVRPLPPYMPRIGDFGEGASAQMPVAPQPTTTPFSPEVATLIDPAILARVSELQGIINSDTAGSLEKSQAVLELDGLQTEVATTLRITPEELRSGLTLQPWMKMTPNGPVLNPDWDQRWKPTGNPLIDSAAVGGTASLEAYRGSAPDAAIDAASARAAEADRLAALGQRREDTAGMREALASGRLSPEDSAAMQAEIDRRMAEVPSQPAPEMAEPTSTVQGFDEFASRYLDQERVLPPEGETPAPGQEPEGPPMSPEMAAAVEEAAANPPGGGDGAGSGGSGGSGGGIGGGGMSPYEQELMDMLQRREKAAEQDKWLALAQVGLNMMSSKSPTLLGAVGEAGLKGVEAARAARDQYDKDRIDILGAIEQSRVSRAAAAAAAARAARAGGISAYQAATLGIKSREQLINELDSVTKAMEGMAPMGVPPEGMVDQYERYGAIRNGILTELYGGGEDTVDQYDGGTYNLRQ